MTTNGNYFYLNHQNQWRNAALTGLVNTDGVLHLAPVPGLAETVGPPLASAEQLTGPAGIGVDRWGNLYLADPAGHRIIRVDACDGSNDPLPCLRGPGSAPGQLNGPRGLAIGSRDILYIADSGNHRIQVVDLATQQVRAIWGQADPYAPPKPGDEPGQFNEPWDAAVDQAGRVYVVDYGNRRVQKFTARGRVIADFWLTLQNQPVVPQEPGAVTTILVANEERLLLVDRADNRVLVYWLDGTYDKETTIRWAELPAQVGLLVDVLADADFLYVADAVSGRVLVFDQAGVFMGVAQGGPTSVAGLAFDCQGRLLIHPGSGGKVQQLQPASAYALCGTGLIGPLTVGSNLTRWHRLKVTLGELPEGGHIQFFTLVSNGDTPPTLPMTCGLTNGSAAANTKLTDSGLAAANVPITPRNSWRPAPVDGLDLLLAHESGRNLWLAVLFQGNSQVSPTLEQMWLAYDHQTWGQYLPTIHQNDPVNMARFNPVLSLLESLLSDEQMLLEALPILFDPAAAPDDAVPDSWLNWLASWLAFHLDETWSEAKRRATLAEAFYQYGRRGTVESLRWFISQYAGAAAHISEPATQAALWTLGEFSHLGFETMLAPAEAQGAVVGTTATLDRSHLIRDEAYGAPLFSDVTHRFCVQVYAADLIGSNTSLDQVRQVLAREKPAHTIYHLCEIDARMRVGFQARLGIDTIIAGPPPDLAFNGTTQLGYDTFLPAPMDPDAAALGSGTRLGLGTQLV
ncbi:MAG: hypothetical protein KJ063_17770 [Anaerolineae bacterium]|nr:hypothetical protein [Anaerolineae bacterium]